MRLRKVASAREDLEWIEANSKSDPLRKRAVQMIEKLAAASVGDVNKVLTIVAYEKVLRQQPDHAGAKTNLNHARYLLKTMLQDPPQEQQNADDEGGEEGEQGRNEQQSEEGENSEQEGQEGEEEPPEGEDESDPSESGGDPQDASAQTQPLKDQNIEAILQSLEDKNREEQKNLRKAKGPPKIREGKWW